MNGERSQNEVDRYIKEVLRRVPTSAAEKARLGDDLRAHLAAAQESGESVTTAIVRLGTPDQVAEEFMQARGFVYASFWRRAAAFALDVLFILLAAIPLTVVGVLAVNSVSRSPEGIWWLLSGLLIALALSSGLGVLGLFVLYFPVAEARFGQTIGKRLLGLRVVSESGLPIGFREALLRRLSYYLRFLLPDALFIPFTQKRQRALDIVARTVVIKEHNG
ncbi:MAG: RDD family protein [Chloroflexota bacterium]